MGCVGGVWGCGWGGGRPQRRRTRPASESQVGRSAAPGRQCCRALPCARLQVLVHSFWSRNMVQERKQHSLTQLNHKSIITIINPTCRYSSSGSSTLSTSSCSRRGMPHTTCARCAGSSSARCSAASWGALQAHGPGEDSGRWAEQLGPGCSRSDRWGALRTWASVDGAGPGAAAAPALNACLTARSTSRGAHPWVWGSSSSTQGAADTTCAQPCPPSSCGRGVVHTQGQELNQGALCAVR